jgi:hypothetical protein
MTNDKYDFVPIADIVLSAGRFHATIPAMSVVSFAEKR